MDSVPVITRSNADAIDLELFWDVSDPQNEGWFLRITYWGGKHGWESSDEGLSIDGGKDRPFDELVQYVVPYLPPDKTLSELKWTQTVRGLGWKARLPERPRTECPCMRKRT